jgi:uncharacterized protein YdiU (UPF0061 family)
VAKRQAILVARWMQVGFIHGVMNTDNMAVSGETIDYGPCAFMDSYDPETVFSAIDHGGRYAFANQPGIAQWNLAGFAETLLPLIDADLQGSIGMATAAIDAFAGWFEQFWLDGMRRKLGLATAGPDDRALIQDLLEAMHRGSADFTLTFRRLCDAAEDAGAEGDTRCLFSTPGMFDAWAVRWRERLGRDPLPPGERARRMRAVDPAFIPRNHRANRRCVPRGMATSSPSRLCGGSSKDPSLNSRIWPLMRSRLRPRNGYAGRSAGPKLAHNIVQL